MLGKKCDDADWLELDTGTSDTSTTSSTEEHEGYYDSDAKYVRSSSDDDMSFEKFWARKEEYDEMGTFLKTLHSSFW